VTEGFLETGLADVLDADKDFPVHIEAYQPSPAAGFTIIPLYMGFAMRPKVPALMKFTIEAKSHIDELRWKDKFCHTRSLLFIIPYR